MGQSCTMGFSTLFASKNAIYCPCRILIEGTTEDAPEGEAASKGDVLDTSVGDVGAIALDSSLEIGGAVDIGDVGDIGVGMSSSISPWME